MADTTPCVITYGTDVMNGDKIKRPGIDPDFQRVTRREFTPLTSPVFRAWVSGREEPLVIAKLEKVEIADPEGRVARRVHVLGRRP